MFEVHSDKRKKVTPVLSLPSKKIKNSNNMMEDLFMFFRQCLCSWDDLNKTAEELGLFIENKIHDSSDFEELLQDLQQDFEHVTLRHGVVDEQKLEWYSKLEKIGHTQAHLNKRYGFGE
ncbi:10833_t:CDS:2, partial [Ambispora gerdemannii]